MSSLLLELSESCSIRVSSLIRTADPFCPDDGRVTTVVNPAGLTRLTSGSSIAFAYTD